MRKIDTYHLVPTSMSVPKLYLNVANDQSVGANNIYLETLMSLTYVILWSVRDYSVNSYCYI